MILTSLEQRRGTALQRDLPCEQKGKLRWLRDPRNLGDLATQPLHADVAPIILRVGREHPLHPIEILLFHPLASERCTILKG